ncbi:hypothetical protein E2C01_069060 [Portunus trituberculatus]|uniref:Uncharacterized protein n=2 Tax=Portunus trituberculatus TaxID=210409 RepID=A0A5B7I165_PORTR|nr:hypothetical protein [Portunus trituberculatus]
MRWLVLGVFMSICCLVYGRDSDNARVAAIVKTTKTAFILTTSTTTTPFTCALYTNTAAICQRRRSLRYVSLTDPNNMSNPVHGSMLDLTNPEDKDDVNERDPRIALSIHFTTTSTFTVTSTSINSAITFSLSFFCTVNGASYPPACG